MIKTIKDRIRGYFSLFFNMFYSENCGLFKNTTSLLLGALKYFSEKVISKVSYN
jgi:hypothetical protein